MSAAYIGLPLDEDLYHKIAGRQNGCTIEETVEQLLRLAIGKLEADEAERMRIQKGGTQIDLDAFARIYSGDLPPDFAETHKAGMPL